jgi:ABC-type transport system substrate-binding protein
MRDKGVSRKLHLLAWVLCFGIFLLILVSIGETATTTQPDTKAAAVQPTKQATPKYGGVWRRSYESEARQLGNPVARPFDTASIKMCRPAIESLLRYDEKGVPVPWLAQDCNVSKDLRFITLSVRNGVKFHDGTNCDAEAIRWNLERYRVSDNPELKAITSIDVLNDSTIRLNLSKWDSTLLGNLASIPGMIISPTAYKANGDDWCRTHPIGTGPFKFVIWQRDVRTKYEKFDGYWQKGKPYLDGLEWVSITDPVTRRAAFMRGEVDDLTNVLPKDAKELSASGRGYIAGCEMSPLLLCFLGDSAHPSSPLSDIRVRRAIEYAIDKQALTDTFTLGLGKVANQYAPAGGWGENPKVVGYPYNPDKAKQLLAEAGYSKGLKIKFITVILAFFSDPVVAIQGYLEKVGISAELEIASMARHTAVLRGGWENGIVVYNASLSEPDIARNLMVNFSSRSAMKGTMLCPEDYEEALAKALAAGDFKTKQQWTWEAQKLLVDKYALATFVFNQQRLNFMANKIHNSGVGTTVDMQYTPEDAWIEQ